MDLKEYYDDKTKTLKIPYDYDEELKNIPIETTEIIFLDLEAYKNFSKYNKPIDNLPLSLTHLNLGHFFNQPVNNLPTKLTHLTFGKNFNHYVDNLPLSLTHLTFGEKFNKKVDKLPLSLTHLTFGRQTPVRLAHPKIMNIFIIV
jgi:hypothetical protein